MRRARRSSAWRFRLAPVLPALLLLGACGGAAEPSAATPAQAHAAERPSEVAGSRGFFHRIRSKTATVYLLGSVHVGNEKLFPMDPPIDSAFKEASTLVLEVDLSEKARSEMNGQVAAEALYPDGQSLETSLDAPTLSLLKKRLEDRGVSFAAVNRMRPWAVMLMLMVFELQRTGLSADDGIDIHFAKLADGKKKIVGIETAEEQLTLFTHMKDAEQALALRQTLETLGETKVQIDDALTAWKKSDERALITATIDPLKKGEYARLYDALIVRRNIKMTDAIDRMLRASGTYFVVVGSMHVVGPDGILARLRAAGYEVVRR